MTDMLKAKEGDFFIADGAKSHYRSSLLISSTKAGR